MITVRLTYVCVGKEPLKGEAVYHRCNGGWQVNLVSPWTMAQWADVVGRHGSSHRCPRCHSRENVYLRAVVRVLDLAPA